jgi:hypothetical protein
MLYGCDGFGKQDFRPEFVEHAKMLSDSMPFDGPSYRCSTKFESTEKQFKSVSAIEFPQQRKVTVFHFHGLFQEQFDSDTIHEKLSRELDGVFSIFVGALRMKHFNGDEGPSYFVYYSDNSSKGDSEHFLRCDSDIIETTCLDKLSQRITPFTQQEIEFLGKQNVFLLGISQGGNVAGHLSLMTGCNAILWRSTVLEYSRQLSETKFEKEKLEDCPGRSVILFFQWIEGHYFRTKSHTERCRKTL